MPAATRARGFLRRRLSLGLAHLVRERGRLLRGEGPTQGWGADGLGRWIGAAVAAADVLGEPVAEIRDVAAELTARQLPDGSFSAQRTPETWWGNSRALVNLLEAWELSRDPELLEAARRLGDFYLHERPDDLSGFAGPLYGAAMEGLVALASATGVRAYLGLAEELVVTAEGGFGVRGGEGPLRHTHTFLSALRGCVTVHGATGAGRPLAAAVGCWERIARYAQWVTGGVSEGSRDPFESNDEACAVADWFRLSLVLWRATGERRFLDAAEHAALNHLLFDQDQSGGFCTYRSVSRELISGVRDIVAWWCCSMHGVRALAEAARGAAAVRDGGIDVALFLPVEAVREPRPGCPVRVGVDGAYPLRARISIDPARPAEFPVRVRSAPLVSAHDGLGEWPGRSVLPAGADPACLHAIARRWRPGDVVELAFEPRLRIIPAGANGFPPSAAAADIEGRELSDAALAWGPLVLMADSSLNPHELNIARGFELAVPLDAERGAPVPASGFEPPGWGEVPFPEACFTVLARDRAGSDRPAGPSDDSWRLAFLVPVAEVAERWSPSGTRTVPYEVRNRIRLVDAVGPWQERLASLRAGFAGRIVSSTLGAP